jgi:LPXTG-motif cell wall-anchored protein
MKGEKMETSVLIAIIFILAVAVGVSITRRKKN